MRNYEGLLRFARNDGGNRNDGENSYSYNQYDNVKR